MLLDRIFGAISATAVLLGFACQATWLTGIVAPSRQDDMTMAFFGAAIVPLIYLVAYAGHRDRLPYDAEGSLELRPIIRALPGWAQTVAVILFIYAFALVGIALVPAIPKLAGDACGAGDCLSWPHLITAMIAMFTAMSFVDAVYLWRTHAASA